LAAREACEGRFEIAIGSGIHNNELQAQRARLGRPWVSGLVPD